MNCLVSPLRLEMCVVGEFEVMAEVVSCAAAMLENEKFPLKVLNRTVVRKEMDGNGVEHTTHLKQCTGQWSKGEEESARVFQERCCARVDALMH